MRYWFGFYSATLAAIGTAAVVRRLLAADRKMTARVLANIIEVAAEPDVELQS